LLACLAGALVAGVAPLVPGVLAPVDRRWLGELRGNPASLGDRQGRDA
jgi:hypothetical protein